MAFLTKNALREKGPKKSGMVRPPPLIQAMPERKRFFHWCLPLVLFSSEYLLAEEMKDHFQKKCWLHQNWYNFQEEFCWKCTHCTKNKNCLQPRLLTATLLLLQLWIRHNCSQLIFYCKTKMFVLNVIFWRIVQVQFFFFAQYLFVSKLQLWRSGSAANDRDPQTSTAMDYHWFAFLSLTLSSSWSVSKSPRI